MPDYRLKPIDIQRQQPRVATDSGKMTEEADRKQASSAPAFEPPVTCIDTGEKELTVDATLESIALVTDFVNSELDAKDCSPKARVQIDIAIDELISNIVSYAFPSGNGSFTVRVAFEKSSPTAVLTFLDRGQPFDPLSVSEPDVTSAAEDRPVGGLGVFLIRRLMNDASYEYRDGQNILRLRKDMRGL